MKNEKPQVNEQHRYAAHNVGIPDTVRCRTRLSTHKRYALFPVPLSKRERNN